MFIPSNAEPTLPIYLLPKRQATRPIDTLRIDEGLLRPADPNSAEERMQFKTGEEIHAEHEARRAEERSQYPLPLRALVEAREAPDDSDLAAYYKALNEVRDNPRPELFQQFAEWVHEGTCEIQGMLETLLFDPRSNLQPWDPEKRRQALTALTDSLPRVKTCLALDKLLVFLLQAQGGGHLKFSVPGIEATIDLEAHRFPDGTGATYSYGSQRVSPDNLQQVARECRRLLRERYPDLTID